MRLQCTCCMNAMILYCKYLFVLEKRTVLKWTFGVLLVVLFICLFQSGIFYSAGDFSSKEEAFNAPFSLPQNVWTGLQSQQNWLVRFFFTFFVFFFLGIGDSAFSITNNVPELYLRSLERTKMATTNMMGDEILIGPEINVWGQPTKVEVRKWRCWTHWLLCVGLFWRALSSWRHERVHFARLERPGGAQNRISICGSRVAGGHRCHGLQSDCRHIFRQSALSSRVRRHVQRLCDQTSLDDHHGTK